MQVADVMARNVISANPHHTVAEIKETMRRRRIHAMPVVDADDHPVGVVTTTDLLGPRVKEGTRVARIMSKDVIVIPQYADLAKAARTMRRNKIHHLVVTHEKRVVGVISSFDVMKVVETHRLVAKR